MAGVTDLEGRSPALANPAGEDWLAHFKTGMVSAAELQRIELPHHPPLLGEWFCEADMGFLFAARGVGKTHLGLACARALAEGGSIGPWKARKAVPVLYVDGEMNAEQIRARDAALTKCDGDLFYLNHELLFARTEKTLNLARRECQDAITAICQARGIRVLFLDNLSTLFSGVAENENDDWEKVLPWLLHLRRLNVAVVIIHHAGRNGAHMRGASRREDAAAWVLRLDDALDACVEIAEAMGVSKGAVSKLAKRAEEAGRIRKDGRKYVLTNGNETPEK